MCLDEPADPGQFFGEAALQRKANRKLQQLCKQVERAAALTLADHCQGEALAGGAVVDVVPAPDAGRLKVTVVLPGSRTVEELEAARSALVRDAGVFRREIARAVHRKRVPEVVFEVRSMEVDHG